MVLISRLLLAPVSLTTGLLGLSFLLRPELAAARLGLQALGPVGLSTLRGDLGGVFLAISVLTTYCAVRTRGEPLIVPLLALSLIVLGRGLSAVLDRSGPGAYSLILMEVVMVALVATSYRILSTHHRLR